MLLLHTLLARFHSDSSSSGGSETGSPGRGTAGRVRFSTTLARDDEVDKEEILRQVLAINILRDADMGD